MILEWLIAQQDELREILRTKMTDIVAALWRFYDRDHDHYHYHDENDDVLMQMHPSPIDPCFSHHETLTKCFRGMNEGKIWRPEGYNQDLDKLIQNIFSVANQPKGGEIDSNDTCEKAKVVIASFSIYIEELRALVRDTWAGVCLKCFRAKPNQGPCHHPKARAVHPDPFPTERYIIQ